MLDKKLGEHIEKKVGLSLEDIRVKSPEEFREYVEKKMQNP